MEEIIEVKQFKAKRNEEWLKESGQQIIEKELEELKIQIKDRWWKRLQGCERRVDVWQKILSVRGLLFNKVENIKGWLGLSKMALEAQQMQLAKRVVDQLKKEWETLNGAKRHPAELIMMELECDYRREVIKDVELMEKVGAFLNEREELSAGQRARCFLKLGYWLKERNEDLNLANLQQICQIFEQSIGHDPKYYKGWNQYAYTNFEIVQIYEHQSNKEQNEETKIIRNKYIFQAIRGFLKAISLEARNAFQDSLRLLTLIFKYGDQEGIGNEVRENLKSIDIVSWVEVIPQIIARIDIPNQAIQTILQDLMIHISAEHPQALIYQLTVTSKSKVENRVKASAKIVEFIKEKNPQLVQEAMIISEELIKTAILLKELWYEGIESAWTMYSHNKNIRQTVISLRALYEKTRSQCQSQNEIAFHQSMGYQIFSAEQWLNQYDVTKDENCLNQAFDLYYHVYYKIKEQLEDMKMVFLENVSPKLYSLKNCEISIPGLYRTNQSIVRIAGFCAKLLVLSSKQRPRKIFIYGSDEKEYSFLLKGHEDMRQDERAMQLFSLVNRLLNNNHETQKKDLIITRYDVVPLSTNTGIIGWVQNSDPLQQLIKTYRESSNIIQSTEFMLMKSMCASFQVLPLPNKVETYRYILENTKGEDLQKVLWLKSPNSEIWLERRTTYTRSLATMSMVGYILGLGDRHPSNIMLNKSSGRIIHIDFGDCWEVAMKREKYPEKVPFRLTRMLVKAMEACGIEGNYRHTSEIVMQVLRDNKESLMAVLEAFVYDPLLHWRLFTEEEVVAQRAEGGNHIEDNQEAQSMLRGLTLTAGVKQLGIQHQEEEEKHSEQKIEIGSMENQQKKPANQQQPQFIEEVSHQQDNLGLVQPKEILNKKALDILDRIKKKLVGKDFKENESLSVKDQVNKLIRQATSHENISQAYLGWCPFW